MSVQSGIKILQDKFIQLPPKEVNLHILDDIERFLIQNPDTTMSVKNMYIIKSFLKKNNLRDIYPKTNELLSKISSRDYQYRNQWKTLKQAIKKGLTPGSANPSRDGLFNTVNRYGTSYIDLKESYLKDLTPEKLRDIDTFLGVNRNATIGRVYLKKIKEYIKQNGIPPDSLPNIDKIIKDNYKYDSERKKYIYKMKRVKTRVADQSLEDHSISIPEPDKLLEQSIDDYDPNEDRDYWDSFFKDDQTVSSDLNRL